MSFFFNNCNIFFSIHQEKTIKLFQQQRKKHWLKQENKTLAEEKTDFWQISEEKKMRFPKMYLSISHFQWNLFKISVHTLDWMNNVTCNKYTHNLKCSCNYCGLWLHQFLLRKTNDGKNVHISIIRMRTRTHRTEKRNMKWNLC